MVRGLLSIFDPRVAAGRRWGAERERARKLAEALDALAEHGGRLDPADREQRIHDERARDLRALRRRP
jgi:hypothetical protein